ncbi:hypothetical protein ACFXJ8_42395 [Nonomuraea sp. NPDC059194]|uniref:hypothetical protein n=1 Tax=Nonomuraea sp. NPDC059194 TaxID=3346764 RepID=UPI0036B75A21
MPIHRATLVNGVAEHQPLPRTVHHLDFDHLGRDRSAKAAASQGLRGAVEVLEELAVKAKAYEKAQTPAR